MWADQDTAKMSDVCVSDVGVGCRGSELQSSLKRWPVARCKAAAARQRHQQRLCFPGFVMYVKFGLQALQTVNPAGQLNRFSP
jgi:hypothetical protein